jgi:DNA repair exonuclease SbcCD ATPase subunit
MITLRPLTWHNCFSYGSDNEICLNDGPVTQIVGTNGTGKSSIPLIIEEVLYNKNSKGIKKADIPNRYIGKGYQIYLMFDKDEDTYEVTVDRRISIKVKLEKNSQDISSHTATNTYKTIQEIIGLDFKTFSQLVYQSTNASLQFLTATDTNRKKFLIDLLQLEEYTEYFNTFRDLAKTVNTEVIQIESQLATIEKWLKDNKLTDTTILPMLDLEIETEDDEKVVAELTKEIGNISGKNKKIIQNNQFIKLLEQIDIHAVQNPEITKKRSYDQFQKELGAWSALTQTSNTLITKMKRLGDQCPTCEQEIDTVKVTSIIEAAQIDIGVAKEQSNGINDRIRRIKNDNTVFETHRRLQSDWESLYRSIDTGLPTIILDEGELSSRLASVQGRLRDARSAISSTAKTNQNRTRNNTRIQVILEQTDSFQSELELGQASLKVCSKLLSNLEVLKKSFSTNGLLAYKIENLAKDLEEKTNRYLTELSDGRFTLEFVVTNDKLNVQITDNGNIVDILALSSGELARVNTATLIAIRKLMQSISKSRINVLFLDEVINVLDETGREKLVEVLLAEDLNTYIVSHFWTHPLLAKIEVIKEDEISRLEK